MTPPRDAQEHGPGEAQGAAESPARRWFVLQALDPITDCAVLEARFAVTDLSQLRAVLGSMAEDDPGLHCGYDLDPDEVCAVTQAFGVAFDPGERDLRLDPWHSIRDVPYLVHTAYELALMLEGRKPFAVFSDTDPCERLDDHMRRFDPFVAEGRLIRRRLRVPMQKPWRAPDGAVLDHWQRIYYALPGEEWRIDAYILLWDVMERAGWNEALERFEGSLLGYEDWQNDWWLRRQRTRRRDAWAELLCGAGRQ